MGFFKRLIGRDNPPVTNYKINGQNVSPYAYAEYEKAKQESFEQESIKQASIQGKQMAQRPTSQPTQAQNFKTKHPVIAGMGDYLFNPKRIGKNNANFLTGNPMMGNQPQRQGRSQAQSNPEFNALMGFGNSQPQRVQRHLRHKRSSGKSKGVSLVINGRKINIAGGSRHKRRHVRHHRQKQNSNTNILLGM